MVITERWLQKLKTMARIAREIATLSHDPKMKVGAVIVDKSFTHVAAWGYNGDHKGGSNRRRSMEHGKSGFIHAECNALLHLAEPLSLRDSLIMVCTGKPCPDCAAMIVNSGIRTVYYDTILPGYESAYAETDRIFFEGNVGHALIATLEAHHGGNTPPYPCS